jgi:hypothetical protein
MMPHAVIDTNVLLVANGSHEDVSDSCMKACIERLLIQQKSGMTVLDDQYAILGEYLRKTHPNQPRGAGDRFLKWLLNNKANSTHVSLVSINETGPNCYDEFPDDALSNAFDPPDRKFVAVANAHPEKPKIWQAADCKWLDWWPDLKSHGIIVEFLCPDDACSFYAGKFPEKPLPKLP